MSFNKPTDLQILQQRVGSAEILLTLICQQLTESQKNNIETVINEKMEAWKEHDLVTDFFDGALHLLKKDV
jgi:hypothetical protein